MAGMQEGKASVRHDPARVFAVSRPPGSEILRSNTVYRSASFGCKFE